MFDCLFVRLWSRAHMRRENQRWCRFWTHPLSYVVNTSQHIHHLMLSTRFNLGSQLSEADGRGWQPVSWGRRRRKNWSAKYIFKKLGHCTWNRACLEGDEAVDEKCREDAEQLSGSQFSFKLDQFKLFSGAWLPTQWTAALFQSSPSLSSRKSAGGTLEIGRQEFNQPSDQMEELHCSREDCPHDQCSGRELWTLWWLHCRTVSSSSSRGLRTNMDGCW